MSPSPISGLPSRRSRLKTIVASLALGAGVATFATLAVATDWPQWRGPERTNISKETGLLDQWPDDGPKLADEVLAAVASVVRDEEREPAGAVDGRR